MVSHGGEAVVLAETQLGFVDGTRQDEAAHRQAVDHALCCGTGHLEVALEVGHGRRSTVDLGVGVDEREVLALLLGECVRFHVGPRLWGVKLTSQRVISS